MIASFTTSSSGQQVTATTSSPSFKSPNLYLLEDMQINLIEEVVFEIRVINVDARLSEIPWYM